MCGGLTKLGFHTWRLIRISKGILFRAVIKLSVMYLRSSPDRMAANDLRILVVE